MVRQNNSSEPFNILAIELGFTFADKPPPSHQTTRSFRTGKLTDGESEDTHVLDAHGGKLGGSFKFASSDRASLRPKKSRHDTGHEFETVSIRQSTTHERVYGHPSVGKYGPLLPRDYTTNRWGMRDFSFVPSLPSLVARGTTAIRDTNPTRNPAALAQALIELKREGLPTFSRALSRLDPGRAKSVLESASDAHLTTQFGIKPLIRDFQDAVKVIMKGQALLDKFEAGAGKKQHRQRHFEPVNATQTLDTRSDGDPTFGQARRVANFWTTPNLTNGLQSVLADHSHTTWTYHSRDWFKGAYIYLLPDHWSEGIRGSLAQYKYLAGMDFDKSLLWEVTPWSWLIDWWSNTGDYISNVESLGRDGLVLLYGYMMRTEIRHVTRTFLGLRYSDGAAVGPVTCTYTEVRKRRIRATPYGFGLDTSGLNARQWSILGALGLTRGNNSLRLSE